MRPPGNTSAYRSQGCHAGEKLGDEPEPEEEQGRDLNDPAKDEDRHEGDNLRPRVHQDIRTHHRSDRTTRTEDWQCAAGGEEGLHQACGEATGQIEQEEPQGSHPVLDVIPEDDQHPHIREEMEPPAVHEHTGEQSDHEPQWVARKTSGNQGEGFDKLVQTHRPQSELVQEHPRI